MADGKGISWENIKGGVVNGVNGYLGDKLRNGDYSIGDSVVADLASLILNADIAGMCNFNDRMYMLMNRLMQININEKNIRFNQGGNNAHRFGQSDLLDAEIPRYSYVDGLNYLDTVDQIRYEESLGMSATQQNFNDYRDNHNIAPSGFDHGNLYPDDLQNLTGKAASKRWMLGNPDSILYKTKKMFWQGKINTIISKFGTNADGLNNALDYKGIKSTRYGESHGRNLLKAGAEKRGRKYVVNGYNNPYCRVWTHHYQYDKYFKTIRPFYSEGSDGSIKKTGVKEFHNWSRAGFDQNMTERFGFGWKNGDAGWEKSVLDTSKGGDGILKIAPKYINGAKSNIHTKDCMFSLENLAWRGYDPYSFEKALSWEQRGPLGGRIMWFPPYGIEFNETTSVNWSASSFIGRGEDVYTYVNTQRSGTLSFLMVVDHPSIIDYASWHDENANFQDTDMLRFFAGCDSLDPNDSDSIMSIVKPTPLTDEYLANYVDPEYAHPKVNTPPTKPEDPKKDVLTVTFYVFYPNNYSGGYDDADYAVSYLLSGTGAGKENDGKDDIPYDFKSLTDATPSQCGDSYTHFGYEMDGSGLSPNTEINLFENCGNYIYAFAKDYSLIETDAQKDMYKWFYRVDGKYSTYGASVSNTYNQRLYDKDGKTLNPTINKQGNVVNTNYLDLQSFGYNSSTLRWDPSWKEGADEEHIYCSFADFAYSVALFKNYTQTMEYLENRKEGGNITVHEDGQEKEVDLNEHIRDVLKKYKIKSINGIGFSNSHGYNKDPGKNKDRNDYLAKNRVFTVANWLKGEGLFKEGDKNVSWKYEGSVDDRVEPHQNSAQYAKLWRSAKITLNFETDTTELLAEQEEKYRQDVEQYQKYDKFTEEGERDGHKLYRGQDGYLWRELEDGTLVRDDIGQLVGVSNNMRGRSQSQYYGFNGSGQFGLGMGYGDNMARGKRYYTDSYIEMLKGLNGKEHSEGVLGAGERNKLRYDQEYYFFRTLEKKDPVVFNKLMDKIKYFDPAFHSMTPEGFNARLTFLNQCTRQGNTVSMSDINGQTANNLAFGRPPFCVLRLGDFYNQMIVIESVNIDYSVSDGIQWDMNTEGIGMQPLLARVTLSFKFIGGSDIAGPIRRLQNAMTFNYYANARFYDNRADRIKYKSEDNYKEVGGGDHNYDVVKEGSWAYITNMYGQDKLYSDDWLRLNAHRPNVNAEMPTVKTPELPQR